MNRDPAVTDRLRQEAREEMAARHAEAVEVEIDRLNRNGFFKRVAIDRINDLSVEERAEALREADDETLAAIFNLAFRSGRSGVLPRTGAERDMGRVQHFVTELFFEQYDAGVKAWREDELQEELDF